MTEKDLRPTRYLLTIRYTTEFITEFFEQNPISQLGIIGMRDGLAVRISDISGNPNDHVARLHKLRTEEPKGQPSLQNALDMARAALFHAPTHTTREVLLIFGSLLSSDPGDIHDSIRALAASHITCTVIGLAAQVAICKTLVDRTNPSLPTAQTYNVALNEQHYRELLMRATTPPSTPHTASIEDSIKASLLMMGFPSRIVDPEPTLCACHSKPTRGGYLCSRCSSKVCALPTTCPACGLTLILSTHLARSYHHLFPLRNWKEVNWAKAATNPQRACFGCQSPFPTPPPNAGRVLKRQSTGGQNHERMSLATTKGDPRISSHRLSGDGKGKDVAAVTVNKDGVSESGRYQCETCGCFFCIDCDVFAHEVVHNCPGCQSREGELLRQAEAERMGHENGNEEAMEVMDGG